MYPPEHMQCEVCLVLGPQMGHLRPADAMEEADRVGFRYVKVSERGDVTWKWLCAGCVGRDPEKLL